MLYDWPTLFERPAKGPLEVKWWGKIHIIWIHAREKMKTRDEKRRAMLQGESPNRKNRYKIIDGRRKTEEEEEETGTKERDTNQQRIEKQRQVHMKEKSICVLRASVTKGERVQSCSSRHEGDAQGLLLIAHMNTCVDAASAPCMFFYWSKQWLISDCQYE